MRIFLGTLAVLAASSCAYAADLAPRAVEPVAPAYLPYSWTGFYIGLQGGYAWGNSTYKVPSDGFQVSLDPKGAFGGIHLGYNYEFPSGFVLGLEGDVNAGDVKTSNATGFTAGGAPVPTQLFSPKLDWFGSARVRAGYAFDRFLPYVTGGVAVGDYEHNAFDTTDPASYTTFSNTYVGWTVGAGLEYAFAPNWTASLEYRYTDYGKKSFAARKAGVGTWLAHNVDLTTSDVRLAISYKF